MQIQKSLDVYHPPLEGGSNGLMPFGAGCKNLNTNSKPNFAENTIYPSPKSQILGSSTLPQGGGDLDRENNISPSQNLQANSTLPRGEGDGTEGFTNFSIIFIVINQQKYYNQLCFLNILRPKKNYIRNKLKVKFAL